MKVNILNETALNETALNEITLNESTLEKESASTKENTSTKESISKKSKKPKEERGSEYISLALYAFLGLGCEVILAYFLEPYIYGHDLSQFTTAEAVLHWCMTCTIWLLFAYFILRYAKKKLNFKLYEKGTKVKLISWVICIALIILITVENIRDVGELKIWHEYLKLGTVKFIFQHIYYLVETVMFTLIIVFGQIAMEKWFKKKNIPYGGILVGCTWGLAHAFTKGSIWIGLEGVVIGFAFGIIYLLLNRDIRKTYLVLALAFIL